jgi:hypothetical protein
MDWSRLWSWFPWRVMRREELSYLLKDYEDMRRQNWQMMLDAAVDRARLEELDKTEAARTKRRARAAAKARGTG